MKWLLLAVGNSLIYAIPILILLFFLIKGCLYAVNMGRKKNKKSPIAQGERFVSIYVSVMLVVGACWIIVTKLL